VPVKLIEHCTLLLLRKKTFAYIQNCCKSEMVVMGHVTVEKLAFLALSWRDRVVLCDDAGFVSEGTNPAAVRIWEWLCKGGDDNSGGVPGPWAAVTEPSGNEVTATRDPHPAMTVLSGGFSSAFGIRNTVPAVEACLVIVRPKCFSINFS